MTYCCLLFFKVTYEWVLFKTQLYSHEYMVEAGWFLVHNKAVHESSPATSLKTHIKALWHPRSCVLLSFCFIIQDLLIWSKQKPNTVNTFVLSLFLNCSAKGSMFHNCRCWLGLTIMYRYSMKKRVRDSLKGVGSLRESGVRWS